MKSKKCLFLVPVILILLFFVIQSVFIYQERLEQQKEYERIAQEEQKAGKERRMLEQQSSFYEKLKYGFNTSVLILGDSMALSEGATSPNLWIDNLCSKLESQYESDVWFKNLGIAYSKYDVGYTQLATLNDNRDYDAVIVCYPAAKTEDELIQYEAILKKINERYDDCAVIAVLANSDQEIEVADTINLIDYYGGIYIDMQQIIDKNGDEVIDHEFYPNDKGYELYTNYVFKEIDDAVTNNKKVKEQIEPMYEQVKQYNHCIFVPIYNCRKLNINTFIIELESFSGKICIQTRWTAGNKAYDIYCDYGNWIARNECSYAGNTWYDTFLFHDVPVADDEIMFVLSRDALISEIKGVYLISENAIILK